MKVNVPEKIYLDKNNITLLDMLSVKDTKRIEYTCTDAFIEKAAEWIKNNWREYINVDKDGVVCFGHWENDFKKYMEEI